MVGDEDRRRVELLTLFPGDAFRTKLHNPQETREWGRHPRAACPVGTVERLERKSGPGLQYSTVDAKQLVME